MAASAAACQPAPEPPPGLPLNSERIEATFGSYGVEVIRQDDALRHTCLYSVDATGRTCRTLAIVAVTPDADPALDGPLAAIRDGASLGATLASAGWSVTKRNRYLGGYDLDPAATPNLARLLDTDVAVTLGLHVYELRARRGERELPVAEVLELHHPGYLSARELARIYRELPAAELTAAELDRWRDRVDRFPEPARFD